MNKLIKSAVKEKWLKKTISDCIEFTFKNSFLVTGICMLVLYIISDQFIYLKISSLIAAGFCLLLSLMTFMSLIKFGFDKLIVEMEIKFFNLFLYSFLIALNMIFLTSKLFI